MFNKSYRIILTGLLSMIIASVIIYLDLTTSIAYALLAIGFVLIGVGILIGFYQMITEDGKE